MTDDIQLPDISSPPPPTVAEPVTALDIADDVDATYSCNRRQCAIDGRARLFVSIEQLVAHVRRVHTRVLDRFRERHAAPRVVTNSASSTSCASVDSIEREDTADVAIVDGGDGKRRAPSSPTIPCVICHKPFTLLGMALHFGCHNPVGRPFKCVDCVETYFATAGARGKHATLVHSVGGGVVVTSDKYTRCLICHKIVSRRAMKRHQRTHMSSAAGVKSFACERGCRHTQFGTRAKRTRHYKQMHTLRSVKRELVNVDDTMCSQDEGVTDAHEQHSTVGGIVTRTLPPATLAATSSAVKQCIAPVSQLRHEEDMEHIPSTTPRYTLTKRIQQRSLPDAAMEVKPNVVNMEPTSNGDDDDDECAIVYESIRPT